MALPLLDALTSGPARAVAHPKRLIVFFSANGTIDAAWRPEGGEKDFVLGEILAPLDPHRSHLTILGGIDAESSYHGPGDNSHWNGMGHMLTGTELVGLGGGVFTGGGVSVDQRIAQQVGASTKLASLELALQWSQAVSMTRTTWLGISEPHHTLSHFPVDDLVAQAKLVQINRWYATQFAYLLQAMKGVPEGDGTLLDHSVVLWCNELGEGSTHSRRNVPYVLAGSADGYFKTGRYLDFQGSKKPWHNDLLVSLCQAMDVNDSMVGNPAYCHGAIGALTG